MRLSIKPLRLAATLGLVSLIPLTQTGCLLVAAAAGTGATVAYMRGDTEATLDSTPDKVTAASKAALEDLKIVIVSSNASGLDGDVVGRTAGDDKVHIVVKAQGERTSSISIRIGTFGDQAVSNRILVKITEKLNAANTAATPNPLSPAPAPQPQGFAPAPTQPVVPGN